MVEALVPSPFCPGRSNMDLSDRSREGEREENEKELLWENIKENDIFKKNLIGMVGFIMGGGDVLTAER